MSPSDTSVVCLGNSLTFGEGASGLGFKWPFVIGTLPPLAGTGIAPINAGVEGDTIDNMIARLGSVLSPHLNSGRTTYLLLQEFTNQLPQNALSTTNAQARWLTLIASARSLAAGVAGAVLKVITMTTTPALISSAYEGVNDVAFNVAVNVTNAWQRANWRTWADGIADEAGLQVFQPLLSAGTYTQAEFHAAGIWQRSDGVAEDDIHFGNTGYGLLAGVAGAALAGAAGEYFPAGEPAPQAFAPLGFPPGGTYQPIGG